MLYMARDQYGNTWHGLKHPRKELMRSLDCKHVSKMYRDKADGSVVWCGYVIRGHWLDLYEVRPVEREAH